MSCFDWGIKSEEDQKGTKEALYPAANNLLWSPKKKLKVFFMNPPTGIEYKKDGVNKEQIIGWMNEWSPTETSSVPKFERTETPNDNDIRIKFTG